MVADKKILLREALKQVQAGKIDKAVESYRAIVKIDPRDASAHNTLGDLYIRQGRRKEAIAEYSEVAALYEKDGFALRAIAICQKLINLDPDQIAMRIKLGDLYSSQKLPAEGRSQYMMAANYYDKKGDVVNALDIFRRIADLDPDNLSVRVKLAGMFEKQKFPEKAAEEYVRAAQGYAEKKDTETSIQLYVRAFKLSPANSEARRRLADHYTQRQEWSVVVGLLETPVAKGSRDPELLVLYAEALTRVNHPQDAVKVLVAAQEREPNSLAVNLALGRAYLKAGEVEKGTSALNRCVSVHLAENRLEPAELLLREMAEAAPDDDKIYQRILEVAQQRGEKELIGKAYLSLAAVYERKKLVRSATGAIEKYLEINPGDAAAVHHLESLRVQTPAPKVEAPPPPPAPVVSPAAAIPPPEEDDVVEINLEEDGLASAIGFEGDEELLIEVEGEEAAAPAREPASVAEALAIIRQGAPERASEYLEEHLGRHPGDVEGWQALIEARRQLGNNFSVRDALLRLADLHRRAAQFEEARVAYKGALDADPRSAAAVRGLSELLIEEDVAITPPPVTTPPVTAADSEEEISIDLFDEGSAEAAREPEPELQVVPEPVKSAALVDTEEVSLDAEAQQFWDFQDLSVSPEVSTPSAAAVEEQPPSQTGFEEFMLDSIGEESAGPGTQKAEPPVAAPEPEEIFNLTGPDRGGFEESLAEADFYFQQGLIPEAESLYFKLLGLAPGHPAVTAQLRKIEEMRTPPPAPSPEPVVPEADVADFSGFMDDIRQELEAHPGPEEAAPEPQQPEAGLTEIFQEFQRSVKEQLGDEDFETHYNLGIAYKEMGLMDEAVAEFTLAEKSPVRRLNAVSMIALCLREMGRFDESALKLRTGISLAPEGSEDQKGFLYDLAALHEKAGRAVEEQETLRRLQAIDPGYRDVAARVGAAPAGGATARKKSKVAYL